MQRSFGISLALAATLLTAPLQAAENLTTGFGTSRPHLFKTTHNVGRSAVEVYAEAHVDVDSLLNDISLLKIATPQSIADRLNETRKQLYPDAEIILSIAPLAGARETTETKASLVKAIYWWNNTNCSTCYWQALYTSSVATMFISDVQYGRYNLYDKVGSANWLYRFYVSTGGSATLYNYGPRLTRGFKGSTASVSSKADIVMYFFN